MRLNVLRRSTESFDIIHDPTPSISEFRSRASKFNFTPNVIYSMFYIMTLAWHDMAMTVRTTPISFIGMVFVAVGTLEFRCTVEGVRRYAKQMTYHEAWADNIDFDKKLIQCVSRVHTLTSLANLAR